MKSEDFVEASGYLRVLEKRMLNSGSVERIIDASSASEVLKLLSQNSEYDFSGITRTEDYEIVLKAGLKNAYDLLYKISPKPIIVDILAAKYVFHNLKVALKSKYLNKNMDYLYSDIPRVGIDLNGDAPEHIKTAASVAIKTFDETNNPQDIDIILDKHMFGYMLDLCEQFQNDFITKYVQMSIDFYNAKTLMRAKEMQKDRRFLNECFVAGGLISASFFLENYDKHPNELAPVFYYKYFGEVMKESFAAYEKQGNYSTMEKLFDNFVLEHVKQAKYIAFGPEILFAYLVLKENEVKQIRILVTCKNNNIPIEALRERLRDNYA